MITGFLVKYWELIVIGFLIADIIVQKTKWKGDDDILAMIKRGIIAVFTIKPGKLSILLIGLFLLVPSLAFADPHLTADPQTGVIEYIITGDINITVPAFDLGDGTVKLWYDLAGITSTTYNIEIKANYALWGESVAIPFGFTKPVLGAPGAIRIE